MLLIRIGPNFRKPARRLDFFIGNLFGIMDAAFGIITLGLGFSSFKANWSMKILRKIMDSDIPSNTAWFHLHHIPSLLKPLGIIMIQLYNILYSFLGLIDNIIGALTFANYSCELQSELTSISLRRLRRSFESKESKR